MADDWTGTLVLTRLLWSKGTSTEDRIRHAFQSNGELMVQVWLGARRGGQRYDLVKGSAWIHDSEIDAMAVALNRAQAPAETPRPSDDEPLRMAADVPQCESFRDGTHGWRCIFDAGHVGGHLAHSGVKWGGGAPAAKAVQPALCGSAEKPHVLASASVEGHVYACQTCGRRVDAMLLELGSPWPDQWLPAPDEEADPYRRAARQHLDEARAAVTKAKGNDRVSTLPSPTHAKAVEWAEARVHPDGEEARDQLAKWQRVADAVAGLERALAEHGRKAGVS